MNKFIIFSILVLSSVVALGCTKVEKIDRIEDKSIKDKTLPINFHGEPSSKGPTGGIENATMPVSAPPEEDNTTAQAVTQNENIKLTLPLKTK